MTENGKVLWVTGAGSGMGRAAALSAAAAGWRVALSGRREEALREVAGAIEAAGGEAFVAPIDVTRSVEVTGAFDALYAHFGRLDALVLAAGLNAPERTWADQSVRRFEEIVDVNLTAVARVIDASLPALRDARGVVVIVSSYSAWRFSPGAGVAYSASKSALAAVAATLNQQEGASGVRACHLCPGDVDTDFLSLRPNVPGDEARAAMLSPDDVARAIRFVLDAPPHVRIDELVVSPVSQR